MTKLKDEIKEAVSSVLPVTCIVFLLSITITPVPVGTMLPFAYGAVMLIIDMGLFSLDTDMSMTLMGEGIGAMLSASKERCLMVCTTFVIGFVITIAEPDLIALTHQVPDIPDNALIWTVIAGVGFLLAMASLRILSHRDLKYPLVLFCILVFILAYFSVDTFMIVAFDSDGVTTGPITISFLMALGIGTANVMQKHAEEENSDIVALCSVGLILVILLLGTLYELQGATYTSFEVVYVEISRDAIRILLTELPHYMQEVGKALLPTLCLFLLFQFISSYFNKRAIIKILVSTLCTFLGLTLFLCGINVGFMPVGYLIEMQIAALSYNWILVPIGVLTGFFIMKAESVVHMLTCQVEDILSGIISTKAILCFLSIDVGTPLGIAMPHILSCISIMVFLIPGYLTAVILSFFVPNILIGIVFDSSGMTSGPMTATFLLSFAMGACGQFGGNVLLDIFDIVAIVTMTPSLTIQILSLVMIKHRKTAAGELQEGSIMEFGEAMNERIEN